MNERGFTLVELMVVIILLAILATSTLPLFNSIIRERQMVAASDLLYTTLYLARSEAIKRNNTITICQSSDAVTCGGTWTMGWLMFEDNNNNGDIDSGEVVINADSPVGDYKLTWSAFGSNNYIRFNKNGMTTSHNGTFKLCPADSDTKFATAVIVSKTARIYIAQDKNENGIREDASGNDLIC